MRFPRPRHLVPDWRNAILALLAAGLLILSFPDFEYWFLAWFALVPLMWAVERQKGVAACFTLGWLFGTTFFYGTCWWLTYAPIHYAAMPWPLAYFLIVIVCLISGLFPAIFTTLLAILIRRFGTWAFLAAPFVWVFTEFLRYWLTGNNWNAVGYSQYQETSVLKYAPIGGVLACSFTVLYYNLIARGLTILVTGGVIAAKRWFEGSQTDEVPEIPKEENRIFRLIDDNPDEVRNALFIAALLVFIFAMMFLTPRYPFESGNVARIVALQPNVPMSGIDYIKADQFRDRHIEMAETEIKKLPTADRQLPTLVVLPESPMNFMYTDDREFQQFIGDFARRNNVSVLFNSAEPDKGTTKYFNSAVMVGPDGKEVAEYDKIYLLPFGEAVPQFLEGIVPGFVGNFAYGREYDLLPVGDAEAGVMICFESHFGQLSREYVRNGADVIIEMTNDGYLGPTPVLRQHLANAVFRAVETNRPVLRVTNVGITAYITETGHVIDPAPAYQEATRTWSVSKSDGSQTFYVKYGDWFAWLCTIVTFLLLAFSFKRRSETSAASA